MATSCAFVAPISVATGNLGLNPPKDTIGVATPRPQRPDSQPFAKPKQDDERPTYDLMALPQPSHALADTKPSEKPPNDLSPNTLASNQNRAESSARSRLSSRQPRKSKQDKLNISKVSKSARGCRTSISQAKRAEKRICSSANTAIATPTSHAPPFTDIARQNIPLCSPELITRCPRVPTVAQLRDPNICLSWQIAMARHLAYNGVSGPYVVGEFLCDLYLANGQPVKIAQLRTDPQGQQFWCHLMTGERLQTQDGAKLTGKPVATSNGALAWMEDEHGGMIPPEWTFTKPHVWSFDPRIPKDPTTLLRSPPGIDPRLF